MSKSATAPRLGADKPLIRKLQEVDDTVHFVFVFLGLLESDEIRAVNVQVSRAVG
jgi:hypothetical protein